MQDARVLSDAAVRRDGCVTGDTRQGSIGAFAMDTGAAPPT
jgi:hypothetical protein